MNLNFCRFNCGKAYHPRKIIRTDEGEWYVCMNENYNNNNECNYVRIEPVPELIDNPPEGWHSYDGNEIWFEHGNAEDVMWKIKLASGETSCPYMAEHVLYDIQHEKKIEEWRCHEEKRKALAEENKTLDEELSKAKEAVEILRTTGIPNPYAMETADWAIEKHKIM